MIESSRRTGRRTLLAVPRKTIPRVTVPRAIIFLALATFAGTLTNSVAHAAEHPAQVLVVESVNKLLEVMRTEGDRVKSDAAFLQSKLDEIVVPHLDFNTMTKLSIGKYWRKADSAQKKELVVQFKAFLLNTYASAVNEYQGGKITFEKFRAESREDRAVVRSKFVQAGSNDVPVVYKLRNKGGWSIYDIEVDQLSLVTNYRSSFATEIKRNGIDGLISLLKDRNKRAG